MLDTSGVHRTASSRPFWASQPTYPDTLFQTHKCWNIRCRSRGVCKPNLGESAKMWHTNEGLSYSGLSYSDTLFQTHICCLHQVSIARRLQDPLGELVKIDPKSLGVGLYQHDVNQKRLTQELTDVVEVIILKTQRTAVFTMETHHTPKS